MTEKNYLNEVEKRVAVKAKQWGKGMDDREDVPPTGSKRPSDEEVFQGAMLKEPADMWKLPNGQIVFMSGLALWWALDKRLTNGKEVLKRFQRGRSK